jgi:plasmid stability protein
MEKKAGAAQFTIRGVPARLESALRERARREGRSLNAVVLDSLAAGAGVSAKEVVHEDLDDLVGTWVEDPDFDRAILAQDQVDDQAWE